MIALYGTMFGPMFHYAEDECIGRSLELYGHWALDEIALIWRVLRVEDGDFIDMGANVGTHSVPIAKLFPQIKVFAFEAQDAAFCLLCASTVVNGLTNLRPGKYLLAESSRLVHVRLHLPLGITNLGAARFDVLGDDDAKADSDYAAQVAIDDVYPGERRTALIKADLEGMELTAFRGAERTIARCRPAIYFEGISDEYNSPLCAFLEQAGYELFWHVNFPFDPENFKGAALNIFGTNVERNILALHRSSALVDSLGSSMMRVATPYGDNVVSSCARLNARLRAELRRAVTPDFGTSVMTGTAPPRVVGRQAGATDGSSAWPSVPGDVKRAVGSFLNLLRGR